MGAEAGGKAKNLTPLLGKRLKEPQGRPGPGPTQVQ